MREERTRRLITVLVAAAAVALAVFLALAAYVMSRQGNVTLDVRIENFVLTHRTGWLVGAMKATTWLGSNVVFIPVVLVAATWFSLRWRDNRSAAELVATLAGAIVLYDIGKAVVLRARPSAIYRVGYNFSGASFPSGHTTSAIAVWGMLAFLLLRTLRPARARDSFPVPRCSSLRSVPCGSIREPREEVARDGATVQRSSDETRAEDRTMSTGDFFAYSLHP